jgi:hypothetical protein
MVFYSKGYELKQSHTIEANGFFWSLCKTNSEQLVITHQSMCTYDHIGCDCSLHKAGQDSADVGKAWLVVCMCIRQACYMHHHMCIVCMGDAKQCPQSGPWETISNLVSPEPGSGWPVSRGQAGASREPNTLIVNKM